MSVCPVDCIYRYQGEDNERFPNQLFINPNECIDCGACEPECPWQAIFEEAAAPELSNDDIGLNYAHRSFLYAFSVPGTEERSR